MFALPTTTRSLPSLCAIAVVVAGAWSVPCFGASPPRTVTSLVDPSDSSGPAGPSAGQPAPRAASPRHFEDVTGDLPHEVITAIAVDPTDPQVLYAGLDGFLFKSDDGGESWRPALSFPRGVAIDDTDLDLEDVAADGSDTGIDDVPSRDVREEPDVPRAEPRDDDERVFADPEDDLPEGDIVGEARDELVDVVVFARATPGVRAVSFVPGTPGIFYVATPRGLYRTTTGGLSFDRIEIPGGVRENDVRDVAVDPARPSRLYVATAAGLLVTRDGGASFRPAAGRVGRVPALDVAAESTSEGLVVLVGTERGLFRSTDGSLDFLDVLLRGRSPFAPVAAVAISSDESTFYAGTAQGLYVGERGASLLERYGGIPGVLVQAISPDPRRPRGVALGSRARGVMFSPDAGLSLEEGAEQVPAGEVLGLARGAALDDVIVATERGVFRSLPGTGVSVTESGLRRLRKLWSSELSLDEVGRAAITWNGLDAEIANGMRMRAGVARWLPQVQARWWLLSGRTSRRDEFLFRAGDELPPGVDPNNDNRDLFGNVGAFVIQPSQGLRQLVWVQLQWDLDKVLLNEDEIAVARQSPTWWAAERRLLDRVITAWAARRRLMTELALADRERVRADIYAQLRIDELTAELDAATGGEFSRRAEAPRSQRIEPQGVQEDSP